LNQFSVFLVLLAVTLTCAESMTFSLYYSEFGAILREFYTQNQAAIDCTLKEAKRQLLFEKFVGEGVEEDVHRFKKERGICIAEFGTDEDKDTVTPPATPPVTPSLASSGYGWQVIVLCLFLVVVCAIVFVCWLCWLCWRKRTTGDQGSVLAISYKYTPPRKTIENAREGKTTEVAENRQTNIEMADYDKDEPYQSQGGSSTHKRRVPKKSKKEH
jgi:hypothetical protein